MEFKIYQDLKEFLKDNEELILEKEWLNNLMVGNFKDGLENGTDENWLFATVRNNEKTELILFKRSPWKLLLYSPTDNKSNELYKFAAEELYKINKEIPGVNTEKEIGEKFSKYYCEIAIREYKLCRNMRILV